MSLKSDQLSRRECSPASRGALVRPKWLGGGQISDENRVVSAESKKVEVKRMAIEDWRVSERRVVMDGRQVADAVRNWDVQGLQS